MAFDGKPSDFRVKQSYIVLIALYVHPNTSNNGLGNKFLENKSSRIFCFRQVYLQNLDNKSGGV